jgi:hypothetical protein
MPMIKLESDVIETQTEGAESVNTLTGLQCLLKAADMQTVEPGVSVKVEEREEGICQDQTSEDLGKEGDYEGDQRVTAMETIQLQNGQDETPSEDQECQHYRTAAANIKQGKNQLHCSVCDKTFKSFMNLKTHGKRIHSVDGGKKYACVLCPKKFFTSGERVMHTNTHLNMKPFSCGKCNKRFSNRRNTVPGRHHCIGSKSESVNVMHRCSVCDEKFASRRLLLNHRNVHTGETEEVLRFECKECRKGFVFRSHLLRHEHSCFQKGVRASDGGEGEGGRLRTKENEEQIEIVERGKTDLNISESSKETRSRRQIETQVHRNLHLGLKPYSCGKCLKTFSDKRNAQPSRHACSEVPAGPLPCPVCEVLLADKQALTEHYRAHVNFGSGSSDGQERYSCETGSVDNPKSTVVVNASTDENSERKETKFHKEEEKPETEWNGTENEKMKEFQETEKQKGKKQGLQQETKRKNRDKIGPEIQRKKETELQKTEKLGVDLYEETQEEREICNTSIHQQFPMQLQQEDLAVQEQLQLVHSHQSVMQQSMMQQISTPQNRPMAITIIIPPNPDYHYNDYQEF